MALFSDDCIMIANFLLLANKIENKKTNEFGGLSTMVTSDKHNCFKSYPSFERTIS